VTRTPLDLSQPEARQLVLAAQGFSSTPPAKPTRQHVRATATRIHALQIDAVNVLVRAHYLPLYARLGAYRIDALDQLTNERHELIEHSAHQASYMPVELEPLLRWRRAEGRQEWRSRWRSAVDPSYAEAVEQEVAARGPLALGDLEDPRRRPKQTPTEVTIRRRDGQPYAESSLRWGRPSDGKTVLDGLLHEGRLALAGRRGFDRLYDLTERVIPAEVRDRPTPTGEEARRELVLLAARALGVATIADLADYFQLKSADVRVAVRELVAAGSLEEARVDGWKGPAFVASGATAPRRAIEASALLGPFDSLTWSRDRTKRLFGFEFSFEIYVPEAKRRFGYYVLPFLLGDALVARVDLKADRPRSTLVVAGAYAEPGTDAEKVAPALRRELQRMAGWLMLDHLEIGERGDLAARLRRKA
jgi:uncharacterized protein YcaQ